MIFAVLLFFQDQAVPVSAPPDLTNHLSFGFVAVWLIEEMKKSNHPMFAWVRSSTDRINKWLTAVSAFLITGGIHLTYDKAGDTLVITGLLAAVMHYVSVLIAQGTWQEFVYRLAFKLPSDLATVRVSQTATITMPLDKVAEVRKESDK